MKTLIAMLLLVGSVGFAADCPDLSGKYKINENGMEFFITQDKCNVVETNLSGLQRLITDGVARLSDKSGWLISTKINYFTSDRLVVTYIETATVDDKVDVQSGATHIFLNKSGNLVLALYRYDKDGNELEAFSLTATRIN